MSLLSKSSNILRSSNVDVKGKISLKNTDSINANIIDISAQLIERQEQIERKIEEAESRYKNIMKSIEEEKEKILDEANNNAKEIEKNAYQLGHEQGMQNGYEDGYKEAYEKNIDKARRESQEIIEKADEVLLNAQNLVANFIDEKKNEILKLSVTIAEQVLREKFKDEDSMSNILFSIIKEYELKKSIIIKTNSIYVDRLSNEVEEWKKDLNIKDEIFVVSDIDIEQGNAIIETNNGKLLVGMDSILDRIKSEIL